MPGLSYQPWKAAKVESGECHQTIRQIRKYPIKVGQTLYHWQQQRTRQRRKLGESICAAVVSIRIDYGRIWVDDKYLDYDECVAIAIADGFDDLAAFFSFFYSNYVYPFEGVVIQWDELTKPLTEPIVIAPNRLQLSIVEVV